MVLATVRFDVDDPEGFLAAADDAAAMFRFVEGFNGMLMRRGVENPNTFLITAHWDTVDAHQAWQAAHADEFLEALGPFIAGPPSIEHFE
jgi:heme-degrading monooxygenase HmoA